MTPEYTRVEDDNSLDLHCKIGSFNYCTIKRSSPGLFYPPQIDEIIIVMPVTRNGIDSVNHFLDKELQYPIKIRSSANYG